MLSGGISIFRMTKEASHAIINCKKQWFPILTKEVSQMDIAGLSAQTGSPSPSLHSIPAGNAVFEDFLGRLKLEADITARLQGVPRDTLSIPPNILEQMEADPAAYAYYMNAIEEYSKAYRSYHCPGLITMSFFITEKGVPCIRGRDELVNRQAAAHEKEADEQPAPAFTGDSPATHPDGGFSNGIYDSVPAVYSAWRKRQLV